MKHFNSSVLSRVLLVTLVLFVSSCGVFPRVGYAVHLKLELLTTTGFVKPTYGTAPPSDPGALYIAEQNRVRIQRMDLETLELTTFIDLPNIEGGQYGLQTFAFHPDYATNGRVYINRYNNLLGEVQIVEFTRSETDPTVLDPLTERRILTVSNPSTSHNGGWLGFGPNDGLLYVLTGDGGAVPPIETMGLPAQDVNDLRGKLLRIDVNEDDFPDDADVNYGIPNENPFATGGGAAEIFALGLRHPYTARFDDQTGDLYIADVGSTVVEEVNFIPAGTMGGQNFGWRALEGTTNSTWNSDPVPPDAIDPIHTYSIGSSGAAIIAGDVYRGDAIPGLQGSFLFGDFVRETFHTFRYDGNQVTELTDRTAELSNTVSGDFLSGMLFGSDAEGEIYVFDYFRGDIYKIVEDFVPGDYNRDDVVNLADYTVWRDALGTVGSNLLADGSGNGVVDVADYQLWKDHFGDTFTSLTLTAVPETGSLTILALGGLLAAAGLFHRRVGKPALGC